MKTQGPLRYVGAERRLLLPMSVYVAILLYVRSSLNQILLSVGCRVAFAAVRGCTTDHP